MHRSLAETVMGSVVLIVAGVFLYFFITTAQIQTVQGYSVSARFGNVGGLQAGSDVRISGIAVGSVLCLLYTSPSPRDQRGSRMPSSA